MKSSIFWDVTPCSMVSHPSTLLFITVTAILTTGAQSLRLWRDITAYNTHLRTSGHTVGNLRPATTCRPLQPRFLEHKTDYQHQLRYPTLCNSSVKSPSWDANSRSAGQEIPSILDVLNSIIPCRVHNSPPVVPTPHSLFPEDPF
jgi:hypothetical protein